MNVTELTNNFSKLLAEAKEKKEQLPVQLSYYDMQQQDLLHYIENNKLNASKQSQIFKLLKEIREKRRLIKQELAQIFLLEKQLTGIDAELTFVEESTTYSVRTDILFSLAGLKSGDKMMIAKDPEVISEDITTDKTIILKEIAESDIESIMSHPEGRRIKIKNIGSEEITICKNFEEVAMKVLKSKLCNVKPKELIKNVSGIMKAIKLGNSYLGYTYEIMCSGTIDTKTLEESISHID